MPKGCKQCRICRGRLPEGFPRSQCDGCRKMCQQIKEAHQQVNTKDDNDTARYWEKLRRRGRGCADPT